MKSHQHEDEIRGLIAAWEQATAKGDVAALRELMAEDVVFLLPGQALMRGREACTAIFESAMRQHRITSRSDIQEVQVSGRWAWCWKILSVTATPHDGGPMKHQRGNTLTVLSKEPDGRWVVYRDANLLTGPDIPGAADRV